jgi:4'-phosphopantetheinyl transferase
MEFTTSEFAAASVMLNLSAQCGEGYDRVSQSVKMHAVCSFQLSNNEVHIWTMPARASGAVVAQFERVLSEDEAKRAARFHFSHLRDSFVITHGVLRHLLAGYLSLDPARICFNHGDKGKPGLASADNLKFNLTHSGGISAIAFTMGCQLGIDAEHIRPIEEMQPIANRYFSAKEAAELMLLPENEREAAFFRCWTRKEAYVKAIGDGLSCALDSFQVTLLPNMPPRLVHIGGDRVAAEMWSLHDLCVAPDYAAALAYRDRKRSLSIFSVPDLAEFANS